MTSPNEKIVRGKEKTLCSNKHKIDMGKVKLTGKFKGLVVNSRCGHGRLALRLITKTTQLKVENTAQTNV
jgi:hypothetical protein